ncbi:F-box domain contaning protein [Rhodotorula toruloides]|nr:F-box domain contaning protein [Rhodotorula toruloides]
MEPATDLLAGSVEPSLASQQVTSASCVEDDEQEGSKDQASKKRKTEGGGAGTASAGEDKLRRLSFSTLPLDMVVQICSFLDPETVLALAQTSKTIRSTLFRKAAAPVWTAARRNAGVDDLTGELPEPRVAFLLQGKVCQVCGSSTSNSFPRFDLQVRACYPCLEANVFPASAIAEEVQDLHPLSLRCSLAVRHSAKDKMHRRREPFYWKPEVIATSAYLHSIDPPAARTDRRKAHPSEAAVAFQRSFDGYKAAAAVDAAELVVHEERLYQEKLAEERERPAKRFKQIQERLIAAGFAEQDTLAVPMSVRNSSEPVTDEYWAQVHSQVSGAVQAQRDRRLQHERSQRRDGLRALYKLLYDATSPAEQEFFPDVHAFLRLPSIEVLWQPEDAVIDMSSWAALTPKIRLDIQRQGRIDKIRYFDQLARALLSSGISLPAYIVNLITAEPSVFIDDADESKGVAPLHDQLTDGQLLSLLHGPLAIFTCSFCGWRFSDPGTRRAPRLITSVGLNSLAAHVGDLENLGPHFEVQTNGGDIATGVHWADLRKAFVRVPKQPRRPSGKHKPPFFKLASCAVAIAYRPPGPSNPKVNQLIAPADDARK